MKTYTLSLTRNGKPWIHATVYGSSLRDAYAGARRQVRAWYRQADSAILTDVQGAYVADVV
jgi:hypothetical protein